MGLLNFVNDIREKKINELTNDEKLKLLSTRKLDDYTLNYIINELNIDITRQPEGYKFIPTTKNKFSEKQNFARMLTRQFDYDDIIKDKQNHMTYLYIQNRATERNGFMGEVDKESLKELKDKNISITIPTNLFGEKNSFH